MKSRPMRPASKATLLVSASVIALAVACSSLSAADLPRLLTKAPAPVVQDQWTWWAEGGLTGRPGADPQIGLVLLGILNPGPGWEGAIGFDYKRAVWAPYHISMQFRFGENKDSTSFSRSGIPLTLFTPHLGPNSTTPAFVNAAGTGSLKEDHWLVDFAVGREFALGSGMAQGKLGIRVAEITSDTTGNGLLAGCLRSNVSIAACSTPVAGNVSFQSRSRFLGFGPRLGIDGSHPIAGSWVFDYLGGVAVLFGQRSMQATQLLKAAATSGFFALNNASALDISSFVAVFNLDAQAGISYWFNRNFKLSASYRFDGYWGALRVIDNGGVVNQNRFYYGPMFRATAYFSP
ncbi:MAG TPA: Lpg1974 family pore-forming outer membrane protein [Xanthobacteraceae bacterium]